jgi:hypothetical protein
LFERLIEILRRSLIARHLEEGVLELSNVGVIVVPQRLVARDPREGAQHAFVLRQPSIPVLLPLGEPKNLGDGLAEPGRVIGLEQALIPSSVDRLNGRECGEGSATG